MKTIEDLLIDAMDRMDRARKLLSIQSDDWQMLNTAYMRDAYAQIKAQAITKSFDSGGNSFTEGMATKEGSILDSNGVITPPYGFEKVYLARGSKYRVHGTEDFKEAYEDINGYFFFKEVKPPLVPCNHCDEAGCTFNCIGHRQQRSAIDDPKHKALAKIYNLASDALGFEARSEVANVNRLTMEQKAAIAKELLIDYVFKEDSDGFGFELGDFENYLNKLK